MSQRSLAKRRGSSARPAPNNFVLGKPQGSDVGPPPSDEAVESLRRLARALIVSAMEAYALQRTAEPSIAPSTAVVSKPADRPAGIYNRRRKRWGRAA